MEVLPGEVGILVVLGVFSVELNAKLLIEDGIKKISALVVDVPKKLILGNADVIDDSVIVLDRNGHIIGI